VIRPGGAGLAAILPPMRDPVQPNGRLKGLVEVTQN
jgi:hypothetical protein